MHYGISLQFGPNILLYNTKKENEADDWSGIYDPKYKGKITVPDNPIQIADAALYLSKTQPASASRTRTSSTRSSSTRRWRC